MLLQQLQVQQLLLLVQQVLRLLLQVLRRARCCNPRRCSRSQISVASHASTRRPWPDHPFRHR